MNRKVNLNRPGRVNPAAVHYPGGSNQTQATAVRRPGINHTKSVNVNQNVSVNHTRHVNVTRPAYTNANVYTSPTVYTGNPAYCPPPVNYNNYCSPRIYNDYRYRRRYRRFNNCSNLFLSLGFFVTRPYSYYDYARVGYYTPIVYGDDNYYRPPVDQGGPEPDANSADNAVATADPTLDTPEQQMLAELSKYVEDRSEEGRFQVVDPAFKGEIWSLELAQAPAVFEIEEGLYSVVAGFEGTLGERTIPSNVNVEFFLAKTADGYKVKEAWISSANGIARNKLFQSPVYPDVKTWREGEYCPFTGRPMEPIPVDEKHG